ncbi:MAG TPA: phosphoserine phosphatase SerB [Acidimicrobiia bacterium]|nr:phosphoserine phosphatase SerB [Acidimicrobiia bacterium]
MSDRSTILATIHGPDRPGISAGLMDVLAATGAEVYDVEQIVVRGRLTLNVLIGVDGEKATIRDLLLFGWEQRLHIEFEVVDPIPTPIKTMTVITILGERIGPDDFGVVARGIAEGGGNIERIFRLSRYPVISYELAVSNGDVDKIREVLMTAAAERPMDIAIQPEGLERRAKRMVVMDVDSTLIENEVINLLADEAGVGDKVAEITGKAMRGEIDFEGSLRERVALLEGLGEDAMERARSRIRVTPGARTFIRTLKRMGMKTAIVSAGFTRFADWLAAELEIDYSLSNSLEMVDGRLTGDLAGELVDGPRKATFLQEIAAAEGISPSQVVAVGDGANDLEMLAAAGLGIAFNAKPVVRERADTAVSVPYLDAILFMMGVRRDHVEAADAADPDFVEKPLLDVPGTPPA